MLGRMINRLLPRREGDPYREEFKPCLDTSPALVSAAIAKLKKEIEMEKEIAPSGIPQTSGPLKTPGVEIADQAAKLNGATAGVESFKSAIAKRMAESEAEISADEWTNLARLSFYNASGQEMPRPAPNGVERFAAPDPDARLPSIADVMDQMPVNTKPVSRDEFERVGKEVLANDPDDFWEFYQEILNRVFGKPQH